MKYINFKTLTIKNFLSIGEEKITINFKSGINSITGENLDNPGTKNATGKSSVIDAFNFAIFGESLRPLNKNQLINNINNSTSEVILEFECNSTKGNNNFVIKRTLNPSTCTVLKDNVDKTRDSIANTTKYILDVLSATQDIFKNCIIMRANNTIPFMAQSKTDKKKFIESIFNLDVITKMSKLVRDDVTRQKKDLEVEIKLKDQIDNNINDYTAKIKQTKESERDKQNSLEATRKSLQDKISKLDQTNIGLLDKLKNKSNNTFNENQFKVELEKLKKSQISLSSMLGSNKTEQSIIKDEINKLDVRGAVCQECKRPFDKNDIEKAKEERKKLSDKLEELVKGKIEIESFITKAKNTYNKKQKLYNEQKDLVFEYLDIEQQVKRNRELIESYNANLDNLSTYNITNNNSQLVLTELLNKSLEDISEKNKIISRIELELNKLEIAHFILSEEGIKSYIIKKLLDLLNFKIKFYLTKQNSQYTLSFNSLFEEEITNKFNLPVSYYNLSGAESKMLDLACIWAFRDVIKLQNSVCYNIAFYDEILDSSMDSVNSLIICSILNEIATEENQSVYVISHKTDISQFINGNIIRLQKQNGITRQVTI